MRVPIVMPQLGYDMTTGRIGSWLKAVGDKVDRGEPIAEIETDKATVEMEALAGGILVEIVHEAAPEAPVGRVTAHPETEP